MKRLAILISGRGSNMRSLLDAVDSEFDGTCSGVRVTAVISNEPQAGGLSYAKSAGLNTYTVDHRDYADRLSHERALIDIIDASADLVILAGYMRVLSTTFVERYMGRLLNIHPSLLPDYPGLNTHQRALDAHDTHAGASVHYVIPALDAGPVILQARVAIAPDDNAATLAARVLEKEHCIYPLVVRWVLQGTVTLACDPEGKHYCVYRGNRLSNPLQLDDVVNELPDQGIPY